MSRKLENLKKEYTENSSLAALVEFLEQCRKEEQWGEIVATLDDWKGQETAETHFYYGTALLYSGKREEGAERLLKVININPNHYNARKELEKFNIESGEEKSAAELSKEAINKILVVESSTEKSEHYKKVKFRNISLIAVTVLVLTFMLAKAFREDEAKSYNEMLRYPEKNFHSLNYVEYAGRVRDYKVKQIRKEIGEPLKRVIFYLTAYAVLDYHLENEKEDMSQFKLFSTMIDKDDKSKALINYIDGVGKPLGNEVYHKLEKGYPDSLSEIKKLDIKLPDEINRANLRGSFYRALMLYRRSDYSRSQKIVDMILNSFPGHELSEKLNVMIKAGRAIEEDKKLEDISKEKALLGRYRTESAERYFSGEAFYLLGKASGRRDIEREGFYVVCPGKYFCEDVVLDFMKSGDTREASRMAIFMREHRGSRRTSKNIKLVLFTSLADSDYSNCYFAFKELQQFFPESVDDEIILAGGKCSEMNGYYEEAIKAYEKINEKTPTPEITAKILKMKFAMIREELYFNQLKKLSQEHPENLEVLYSFLEALKRTGDLREMIAVLDKIYFLESPESRMSIISEYIKNGAVMQAVERLEKGKNKKEYRAKLAEIYNRYMLFDKADAVLAPGEDHPEIWKFFREQFLHMEKEEYEHSIREIDKKLQMLDRCEPALLYLKAEMFRRQGDRQRTLSMIDNMIECDRYYMPGLIFAAEITFYQGDTARAVEGISYILDNERFFSPGSLYYRNYLVLLNAEIMVTMGRDSGLENYLRRNLLKSMPLGEKEMEKVNDIASKLKLPRQKGFLDYLRRNFRILRSEN